MNQRALAFHFTTAAAAFLAVTVLACSAPISSAPTSNATPDGLEVVDLAGTWAFDLEASDPAASLREECTSRAGGDAETSATCWSEIAAEAKREKLRFTKDPKAPGDELRWTSFAASGERDLVFVEAPVKVASDGAGGVVATIAGSATGRDAARLTLTALRVEVVDPQTISVVDPRKGRLVYHKE